MIKWRKKGKETKLVGEVVDENERQTEERTLKFVNHRKNGKGKSNRKRN